MVDDHGSHRRHSAGTIGQDEDRHVHYRHPALVALEAEITHDNGISPSRNIYFMDGANRFISLPTMMGHASRATSHVARVFEQWLQDKLGYQSTLMADRLPILEDSVDLLAEDIMNKLKSRSSVRGLTGVRKLLIHVRAGHVYSLDQLDNAAMPPLSADMLDFFQQFPLFIETTIFVTTSADTNGLHTTSPSSPVIDDAVPVLITLENMTSNPNDPYYLYEDVPLVV
ncbi:hypothetical protein BC940DRAFT_243726 [Gongronella butleri]|nr:hypothetical protein BC940DRAFT_243726 [Gongronella butleri]